METPQGKEFASKGYACLTFGITLAKLRSGEISEKPQKTSYMKLTAKYATKQQRDLLRYYYGEARVTRWKSCICPKEHNPFLYK
mmetsp:Transcript_18218/g.19764  ORF Transcript_18218/g.19764 Transcript_18218/m.19764 type:complete len:84 (+) Transcript_18218:777-1028(+)